jgi:hypothetical protein
MTRAQNLNRAEANGHTMSLWEFDGSPEAKDEYLRHLYRSTCKRCGWWITRIEVPGQDVQTVGPAMVKVCDPTRQLQR